MAKKCLFPHHLALAAAAVVFESPGIVGYALACPTGSGLALEPAGLWGDPVASNDVFTSIRAAHWQAMPAPRGRHDHLDHGHFTIDLTLQFDVAPVNLGPDGGWLTGACMQVVSLATPGDPIAPDGLVGAGSALGATQASPPNPSHAAGSDSAASRFVVPGPMSPFEPCAIIASVRADAAGATGLGTDLVHNRTSSTILAVCVTRERLSEAMRHVGDPTPCPIATCSTRSLSRSVVS